MFNKEENIQLIECPRDAIQGLHTWIPTEKKIAYINHLMDSQLFHSIDFGSFVSAKAVPQMQDSTAVLEGIIKKENTKLSAVVLNERGAEAACDLEKIDVLGFPFSISETFQQRNAHATMMESFLRVQSIKGLVSDKQELMLYISMAFGNPYGDAWSFGVVEDWVAKLASLGIQRFSLADTTAEARVERIEALFSRIKLTFPDLTFSIHLHSHPAQAPVKIEAAYAAGCRIFEGAMLGYGGCPFAQDELVGNIPMELLLAKYKEVSKDSITDLQASFQALIRNDDI